MECCEKYKNTHIFGESINFCPICGASFTFETSEYPSIQNHNHTARLTTRPLDINISKEKDFLYELALKYKAAQMWYVYKDIREPDIYEFMKKFAKLGEWNYISGFIKKRQ